MAIEPKEYKVKENVNRKDFLNNSFEERIDYYITRKKLYKDTITLTLMISKPDYYVITTVNDSNGFPYSPFYNADERYNNMIYSEVVKKYNDFMDGLVSKNILEYDTNTVLNYNGNTILIKYHTDIEKLHLTPNGDWCDLRVAEDIFIPLGEYRLVSLGVSMKLPEGYEAHIVPRSSTFKNWGIIETNHMGIIDNSYSGDNDIWKFPAYCLESHTTVNGKNGTMLKKNDRICQFRIVEKMSEITFREVEHLNGNNRGGFGSTGKD